MLTDEVLRLCAEASVEQDPDKLMKLVQRICQLLDVKPLQFPSPPKRPLDPAV